ncbi:MAG TPA: hypothetical protein ENJ88_08830 [Phaeodactylibacter sp.]|nr:hypothetical protein [Phaeodactylibacter sp.]
MIKRLIPGLFLAGLLFFSACYYDNKEDLYIVEGNCNTTDVTFSQTIQPLINDQCVSCHKAGNANGNVLLDSYTTIKEQADNGRLLGSVHHEGGYSAMPPGSTLSNCSLAQLDIWVQSGAPEN